jgi:hypothetical protein
VSEQQGQDAQAECQRCGSDEWTYVDYGGCSVCRPREERTGEDVPDVQVRDELADEVVRLAECVATLEADTTEAYQQLQKEYAIEADLEAQLAVLTEERDEARAIVEQLRRHGGDWIVEAAEARIGVLEAALRERADSFAIAHADADYVLRWLYQTNAPANIIGLQERARVALGGGQEEADGG